MSANETHMDVILPDCTVIPWPQRRPPLPQTTFWFRGKLFRIKQWHARWHKGRFVDVAIATPEHPITVPDAGTKEADDDV